MAKYKVDCSNFSALGGGEHGVLCSCKKDRERELCPHQCKDYDPPKRTLCNVKQKCDDYWLNDLILDFGAGGCWYRAD